MQWSMQKLGDIASLSWGNTSITKKSYVEEGFTAYSASGPDGFLPHAEIEGEGIVLSAIGARCGKCFFATGEWTAIKNTITITHLPDSLIDMRFLWYCLNRENIWPIRGGGQPFIGLGTAKSVQIALPPLDEQRRIAAILDKADEIKRSSESVPNLRQQLILSTFNEIFGDICFNPFNYETDFIGNRVNFVGGSQPNKKYFSSECGEGYIRFIQIRDYKSSNYLTYIPENMTTRFCSKNDIMIGRYGPPVFQILRGIEGAYNVALIKCIPDESITNEYLYYLLQHKYIRNIVIGNSQRTAGQSGVNLKLLNNIQIPIPPKILQERFTLIVDHINKLPKSIDLASHNVSSITQQILS